MNRKQFSLIVTVAVFSGLVGGGISSWFFMTQLVLAQDSPQKVIETQEFRVVDGEGKDRATLGINQGDEACLYLLDSVGNTRIEVSTKAEGGSAIVMRDKTGHGDFIVSGLELSEELYVGVTLFHPDGSNMMFAPLGMSFTKDDTKLSMRVDKNVGAFLSLTDNLGNTRATLGTTELKHPRTGSTEIRAVSSLVLFDEEGKVVWSAP